MKKWILLLILLVIIVAVFIAAATIDFGSLTISLIERAAKIDIEYGQMKGNIFRGYRIEQYNVRISETDSIFGEIAEINYRFKPLAFRLPNLFEVNLIEPTASFTRKRETVGGDSKFSLPRLSLGLRVNIKNGRLMYDYDEDTKHTLEDISGLVFIDFVATKIYINTINLSVTSKEYPLKITAANLDLQISDTKVDMRSLKVKGMGLSLDGKGSYIFEDNSVSVTLRRAEVNLQKFGIHEGTVHFTGTIDIADGHITPKIRGTALQVAPSDKFDFETNVLADTIWVNIFDGQLWQGNLFAQVKYYDAAHWEFEANFNGVNIAQFAKIGVPAYISGYCGYRNGQFVGCITPSQGLKIDSLRVHGEYLQQQVSIDTLCVFTNDTILKATGLLYPKCQMDIQFHHINAAELHEELNIIRELAKLDEELNISGEINGRCGITGDSRKLGQLAFSIDASIENIGYKDLTTQSCTILSDSFRLNDLTGYLYAKLTAPAYRNITLDTVELEVDQNEFRLSARRDPDTCVIHGSIAEDWTGTVTYLFVSYQNTEIKSLKPFMFDIPKQNIGELDIALLGGQLRGTIKPRSIDAQNLDLQRLGILVGLEIPIQGDISIAMSENTFSIDGHMIDFLGLEKGTLILQGELKEKQLHVTKLEVSDSLQQHLDAHGVLSFEHSHIEAEFSNLGVWILPFLNSILLKPSGILTGNAAFDGNIENFTFAGAGRISDASFGVEIIGTQIDSLSSVVRFNKNRIVFESAQGKVSMLLKSPVSGQDQHSAPISAGGFVALEPRFGVKNFNFDVSFDNAPLQYPPFAYGTGSGNFSFGMRDGESYYNGTITVKQAVVPLEFGQEFEEGKEPEANERWRMNVRIKGERNIWLRNREADIEFGGEIFIMKEQGPFYITGNLETRRGNFYWLNHVLSITNGTVTFVPEEQVDADLDFWAEMRTRDRHPTTNEEIKIKLHCFGSITEPIFEFFSEPPYYSEQDIMTYLNLNISWRELESMREGQYVGAVLPNALLSWLESDVSRRIRRHTGLDYFRIETPFFEPESKTRVTVGKYISKDIFITYTYDITSFSNEFNVEYFIDDKNEIIIKKDASGEYGLQYQYRIRF